MAADPKNRKEGKRDIFADFERQHQLQNIERIREGWPEDAKEMELEMQRKDKASGYIPKKMKKGGMVIKDRQYLKGK